MALKKGTIVLVLKSNYNGVLAGDITFIVKIRKYRDGQKRYILDNERNGAGPLIFRAENIIELSLLSKLEQAIYNLSKD